MSLDDNSIRNVKFILYCFENMSGLRINYQKSEFMLGVHDIERQRIADMSNCNIGSLPMKYLGIMVNDRHMYASDLAYVHQKVEKKLLTWQSATLSSGGKMVLIEACLSSIPNYSMSVYLLPGESHQRIDTARSNFFWHGPNLKKKYHMASWENLMKPENAGGLGFTDTRVMNRCLLAKWIFRIESVDDSMCCNLLRKKYLGDKGFFHQHKRGGSQFWRELIEVGKDCEKGLNYILGDGRKIRFWWDVWQEIVLSRLDSVISSKSATNKTCMSLRY